RLQPFPNPRALRVRVLTRVCARSALAWGGGGCVLTRPSPQGTVPFQEIVSMMTMHPFAPGNAVSRPGLQENFLRILPCVQQHAHCYFRHLGAEAREEAVAQATA